MGPWLGVRGSVWLGVPYAEVTEKVCVTDCESWWGPDCLRGFCALGQMPTSLKIYIANKYNFESHMSQSI